MGLTTLRVGVEDATSVTVRLGPAEEDRFGDSRAFVKGDTMVTAGDEGDDLILGGAGRSSSRSESLSFRTLASLGVLMLNVSGTCR